MDFMPCQGRCGENIRKILTFVLQFSLAALQNFSKSSLFFNELTASTALTAFLSIFLSILAIIFGKIYPPKKIIKKTLAIFFNLRYNV